MTVSTLISSVGGTYTLTINATAPNIRIVPITVTLRINSVGVTLSATPSSRTVNVGQTTTYTININRTNYTGAVNLSAGLPRPAGITMSFSPSSTMGNSSTLTVTTTANVVPGTYTLNVIGTVPGLTIAPINVTLITNPAPRVTLSSSPTSRTIHECGTATYQLALSRVNFSGAVSFSVSGLPSGATASFNPASTNGNSSTLTVYVADSTPEGSWTLTISGVGSNVSISPINVTLTTYFFDWLSQSGSADQDVARGVAVDNSGSVYIVGETSGDFDNAGAQTSAGMKDAWLARYSTSGTLQWVRQFGTTDDDAAEAVAVDSSGDIYVGGWTCGDITTGGPGPVACGAFLAKYNSAGTRLWIAQFDTWVYGTKLGVAVNRITGDVYLTGTTQLDLNNTFLGYTNAFLAKYNGLGTPQWTTQWGVAGDYDWSNGVAVDDAGNIFVTGELNNNVPDEIPTVFVRKYDSSGTLQWSAQLDTSDEDYATGVAVSGSDVYVTGYTFGDLDGSGPGINYGYSDAFLAKYDGASGTLQWTRQFGTTDREDSRGVSVDSSGNIYIAGSTWGDLDGPGPITNVGWEDLFIAMYDAAGTLQWIRQFGSARSDYAEGGLAVGSSSIYVTGKTDGDLDGPGTGTRAGSDDAWVGRFTTPVAVGPFINSFTPTSGLPGTSVTITGSNFNGVSSVKFNGMPALFTVNSSTQITATVPGGATTGKISVMTACGTNTSATDFIVPNIPQ